MNPLLAQLSVPAALLVFGASAGAQGPPTPIVRVSDATRNTVTATPAAPIHPLAPTSSVSVCSSSLTAGYGSPVPGGGTLASIAHANAPARWGLDGAAFFSQVNGSPSNQGIFAASPTQLVTIVRGSGGGGGSGVPGNGSGTSSPIGGNFSGFFGGTFFAPAVNRGGDVLFLADVDGGSSTRGLFLYVASQNVFQKVAAVGDPSPVGGTLLGVGPGSMNDAREVVFLAKGSTAQNDLILHYKNGVLTKVAANGDPAPGGGSYSLLGTESLGFVDGTSITCGPLPDINGPGQISFRAITNINTRGIVVVQANVHQWYVQAGDPTPHGGTYFDMQGAMLDDEGRVAFFADWKPTSSTFNSGWFVGKPGAWRSGLSFYDPVGGGQCFGLAFSRNPMQPLDEQGNLLQWILIDLGAGVQKEAMVISAADGTLTIAAQQGNPAPGGGNYSTFDAWPSMSGLCGVFGAATPGGPHLNAYCNFTQCTPAPVTYCTSQVNSLGCMPSMGSSGTSSSTMTSGFTVSASALINNKSGLLIYSVSGRASIPFGLGTLCLAAPIRRTPVQSTGGSPPPNNCTGALWLDMNAFAAGQAGGNPIPALLVPGTTVRTQVRSRDQGIPAPNNFNLTNALEYVVGM